MAPWQATSNSSFVRRIGKSAHELGDTSSNGSCPDIWELDSGDFAVIGTDLTEEMRTRLPESVSIDDHERLVVIPRNLLVAAKESIPSE